jgi:general stress protein 26
MVRHAHEPIAEIAELIKDIRVAMLTTVDRDGSLHSRPMATQEASFDGELWFFTGQSTHKVEEVRARPRVSVSYASPREHLYLSLSGRAEVVVDGAKMRELWRPSYKLWFPQGLDDPDLALLRVRVEQAEYWRSHGGAVVAITGMLKGMTGHRGVQGEAGEHRYVRL